MADSSAVDSGAWQPVLKADDAAGAQALLDGNADPMAREPPFGWTPLHTAAGYGAVECCEVLLKANADPTAKATDGETPLHLAAQDGKEQAIRRLVEAKAQVDAVSEEGETPLHVAVQHLGGKGLEHLRALMELRADPSILNAEGQNAQAMARLMTNRADELIEVLGAAEAPQPEHSAGDLEQVLRVACRRGQASSVRELLQRLRRLPGQAAAAAASRSLVPAAAGGSVEVAELLLAAGADVRNAPTDERGTGPLVAAADEGAGKMVRWLLSHDANPDGASRDGATALMASSGRGATDCVSELLAARASPNLRSSTGFSPLMLAVRGGRSEVVRSLLDAKAEVDAVAEDGTTARKYAVESGRSELVKVLDARQRLNARRAKAAAEGSGAQAVEDTRNLDDLLKSLGEAPKPKTASKATKKSTAKAASEATQVPPAPPAPQPGSAPEPAAGAEAHGRSAGKAEQPAAAAKGKAAKAAAARGKASRAKAVEARLQEIAAQRAELDSEEKALRAELATL